MNRVIVLLIAAVAFGACSRDPAKPASDAFEVVIAAPASISFGEPATVQVALRNVSPTDGTARLIGNREYTFVLSVISADGTEIYRSWTGVWSGGDEDRIQVPASSVHAIDKIWEGSDASGNPVSPGAYLLRGTVYLVSGPISATKEIVVTP